MRRLCLARVQRAHRALFIIILLALLYGAVSCSALVTPTNPRTNQSPAALAEVQQTASPSPERLVSPEASEMPCAYVWANQDLPDVTETLQNALQAAGLQDIEAHAIALGENCIDPGTGNVVRFLAAQTDFRFVIPVDSIDNAEELGERVEMILTILEPISPGQVPGPNPGYVRIQFLGKSAETGLFFPLQNAQDLLRDGLSGSALYRALESQ